MNSPGLPGRIHPRTTSASRSPVPNDDALGTELVDAMGSASACLLRGHGIVTTGASLEEAVVAAANLEALARVTVELHRLGVRPEPIDARDLAQLPDLGRRFNDGHTYRHLMAQLDADERHRPRGW